MNPALLADNRRGVLAMAAGMASFVANDSLVKLVSESLPAPQLIFVRGVFATLLLLVACAATGVLRHWRTLGNGRVLLRAGFDSFATLTYLTSLFHLPIGTATAINMATPLVITLLAVVVLHERVGLARWCAIATGFVGVLLVVQPTGAGFNAWSLLCLAGTLLHAGRDLTTRTIDRAIPSLLVTLSTALAVTLLAGAWSLFVEWRPMAPLHFARLGAAAVFLSAGYFLLTLAMRRGEMSVIAPFRYTALLFALVLGFAVWGEVPNPLAVGGIALLVAAGVWVLHAERMRARSAAAGR